MEHNRNRFYWISLSLNEERNRTRFTDDCEKHLNGNSCVDVNDDGIAPAPLARSAQCDATFDMMTNAEGIAIEKRYASRGGFGQKRASMRFSDRVAAQKTALQAMETRAPQLSPDASRCHCSKSTATPSVTAVSTVTPHKADNVVAHQSASVRHYTVRTEVPEHGYPSNSERQKPVATITSYTLHCSLPEHVASEAASYATLREHIHCKEESTVLLSSATRKNNITHKADQFEPHSEETSHAESSTSTLNKECDEGRLTTKKESFISRESNFLIVGDIQQRTIASSKSCASARLGTNALGSSASNGSLRNSETVILSKNFAADFSLEKLTDAGPSKKSIVDAVSDVSEINGHDRRICTYTQDSLSNRDRNAMTAMSDSNIHFSNNSAPASSALPFSKRPCGTQPMTSSTLSLHHSAPSKKSALVIAATSAQSLTVRSSLVSTLSRFPSKKLSTSAQPSVGSVLTSVSSPCHSARSGLSDTPGKNMRSVTTKSHSVSATSALPFSKKSSGSAQHTSNSASPPFSSSYHSASFEVSGNAGKIVHCVATRDNSPFASLTSSLSKNSPTSAQSKAASISSLCHSAPLRKVASPSSAKNVQSWSGTPRMSFSKSMSKGDENSDGRHARSTRWLSRGAFRREYSDILVSHSRMKRDDNNENFLPQGARSSLAEDSMAFRRNTEFSLPSFAVSSQTRGHARRHSSILGLFMLRKKSVSVSNPALFSSNILKCVPEDAFHSSAQLPVSYSNVLKKYSRVPKLI